MMKRERQMLPMPPKVPTIKGFLDDTSTQVRRLEIVVWILMAALFLLTVLVFGIRLGGW